MSAQPRPLDSLILRVADGDRTAFAELYDATSSKLFGITLRIVRNRSLAEDAMQETYLRVWRFADGYDPTIARPMTWLAAIARNAAIDEVRRKGGTARAQSGNPASDDEIEALMDPLQQPAPWDLEALRRCLDQLDPVQKEGVLLAYYEGYSREELGVRFDRPVGTIKTWLHRALLSLRDCLGQP